MISVVIIAKNEAERLPRCLQSVAGVADEIIVADTGSTDHTAEIAIGFGAKVHQLAWQGFAQTKNEANALATHPYILSLDADEVLSDALRHALLQVKANLTGAYQFARLTAYCGHWIRHGGWYPDLKVRLFPKEKAHWEGAHVHERLVLAEGLTVHNLTGDLLHYSIDRVATHWQRLAAYAPLKAQVLFEAGKTTNRWHTAWRTGWKFFSMYVLKGGFRDGRAGWQLARLSAAGDYLKWATLYELHHPPKAPTP